MVTFNTGDDITNLAPIIASETVVVQPGAILRANNNGAALDLGDPFAAAADFVVTIDGALIGYSNSTNGIWFHASSGTHSLEIGATGSVSNDAASSSILVGTDNLLSIFTNNGVVSSTSSVAILAFGDGATSWTNNGLITSQVSSAIEWQASGIHDLRNNGVISGGSNGIAIFGNNATGIERIVNTGVINGNVDLGGGSDEVNTYVGRINGTVNLGDGEDIFNGSNTDSFFFLNIPNFVQDVANGGNGNDILYGYAGNDTLNGDAGNDEISGGAGDDNLSGGSGDDAFGDYVTYVFATSAVTVSLATTTAQNTRGDGIDTISGFENLIGSSFDDTLSGDLLANRISGLSGNDVIFGGADSAADRLSGGLGNDSYIVRTNDEIIENLGLGTADKVRAQTTFVLVADDNIEILETYSPTATTVINLTGNALAQTITGNYGANILMGLGGIDKLTGGRGKDSLFGGTEKDTFDFNVVNESGLTSGTRDIIQDFVHGLDKIDLSTIDANTATSTSSFGLLAKGTATSAVGSGKIGWYQINAAGSANDMTILRINNDADASIEMTIQLKGLIALTSVDFVL